MNNELKQLYQQQLRDFPLAKENYAALRQVQYRDISPGEYTLRIQYNPARILSTNAKIDKATLQQRKCFLCAEHRPAEQKGIAYGGRYHICVNPYPIFKEHYTVPDDRHVPQLITRDRFEDLLSLAFDFREYTAFYNGPACGASAPDHFHFQLAPRYSMPLEKDTENARLRQMLLRKEYYSVSTLRSYLREVLIVQASDLQLLSDIFLGLQESIGKLVAYTQEPMMNVICWFDNCQWTVCIFPRKQLRPRQFFAEGEEKTLFSPGCVDMAGLIIAPRKEDFDKYSLPLLTDLFRQVTTDAIIDELFH